MERYDTPFSMLMIDIDYFKKINDQHGHSAGDTTLKSVCETIKNIIRQSDELFRFGGEEFVVLLNNSDVNSASFMAERIRQAIEQVETLCENGAIKVTVSIGVAHFNKTECMDQLFNRAEKIIRVRPSAAMGIFDQRQFFFVFSGLNRIVRSGGLSVLVIIKGVITVN